MEIVCRLHPGEEGGLHVRGDPVMKPCLFAGRTLLRTAWWLFPESVPSLPLDMCLAPGVREAVSIAVGVSHCKLGPIYKVAIQIGAVSELLSPHPAFDPTPGLHMV